MRYNSNCKRGKQTELTKYLEKADKYYDSKRITNNNDI